MTAAVPAPYDVFVSYNWRDREAVERVARALRESGLNAFLDRWYLVPGEPWQRTIAQRLVKLAPTNATWRSELQFVEGHIQKLQRRH